VNRAYVKALKQAKATLPHKRSRRDWRDRPYENICAHLPWNQSGDRLRLIIRQRLSECEYVQEYLKHELKIPKKLLTVKNVQEFRHRWLDALIEEFSQ